MGLQPAQPDHARQCRPTAAGVDFFDRDDERPPRRTAREQRRDVRRHAQQSGHRGRRRHWTPAVAVPPALPPDLVAAHITSRGVALAGDKVYFAAAEAAVALNARTGREVWTAKVEDNKKGYYMSLAPLVAGGKVIVGTSGGEYGVRGFVAAYDAETGAEAWKTYTVPAPGEPGSETWPARRVEDRRRIGLGDGQLRSGNESHLLGHRQRRTLDGRSEAGRQPLHLVDDCHRCRHRPDQGALQYPRTTHGTGTRSLHQSSSTTRGTDGRSRG